MNHRRNLIKLVMIIFVACLIYILPLPLPFQSNSGIPSVDAYPPPPSFIKPSNAYQNFRSFLPLLRQDNNAVAPAAPSNSRSHYISSVDYDTLENLGCVEAGNMPTDRAVRQLIILSFGAPKIEYDNNGAPIYKVLIYDYQTRVSLSSIFYAARGFMAGFHRCATDQMGLDVLVGITNDTEVTNLTSEFGKAWADQVVDPLHDWIGSGTSWAYQLTVGGAMDVEFPWNSANITKPWIEGFVYNSNQSFYNFGSCDSCAYSVHPEWSPNGWGWTQDEIWHVSYGLPRSLPIPQIYATNGMNSSQWQYLKKYAATCTNCLSYASPYKNITYQGSLTQYNECLTHPQTLDCQGLDNSPSAGWQMFWNALISETVTSQSSLRFSTDMTWDMQ